MATIGFSTGALAHGNFALALSMMTDLGVNAVELSALRENEFDALLNALPNLRLPFDYISFHSPSICPALSEEELVGKLQAVADRGFPIIVHPDTICNFAAWRQLGAHVLIENMDLRKKTGRIADELMSIFERLPEARMCFDIAHAHQVDRSMTEAERIIDCFGERIAEIHISEVDDWGHHHPIGTSAQTSFRSFLEYFPADIPFIIESEVTGLGRRAEVEAVLGLTCKHTVA